jgi:putative phage-type endonuclease
MKQTKYEDRLEWLAGRVGKITGSRLKDIVQKRATAPKIGYYELIAERLGVPADGENPMERGTRLESEALDRFAKESDRNVNTELVIWEREDNPDIAISPDGIVDDGSAVEVKCLSSARHIEAKLTGKIPSEYWYQALQYFVVNDELQTLHFVFYDPRFSMFVPTDSKQSKLDYFVIMVERKDVEEEVKELLEYQKKTLKEIEGIVNQLTF